MSLLQQLPYQPHQEFTLESCLFLGITLLGVALVFGRKWRQDIRNTYPAYNEIPAIILSHMPRNLELQELDNAVDVVVSL